MNQLSNPTKRDNFAFLQIAPLIGIVEFVHGTSGKWRPTYLHPVPSLNQRPPCRIQLLGLQTLHQRKLSAKPLSVSLCRPNRSVHSSASAVSRHRADRPAFSTSRTPHTASYTFTTLHSDQYNYNYNLLPPPIKEAPEIFNAVSLLD